MQVRFSSWALLPMAVALTIAGCTNPAQVDSISVTPTAPPAINIAQTLQFTATGTYNHAAPHPPTEQDLTDSVTWTSSDTQVATISPTGLATAVGAGTATITASINGFTGLLTSTATLTVTIASTGGGSGTGSGTTTELLESINIIPGNATVSNQGMTAQFLAFGTFSEPPLMRDITNEVTWISSFPEVASIYSGGTPGESAGLATAEGYTGNSVIYALDTKTNKDGTVVLSNSQTFTCKDPTGVCEPEVALPQFATASVYIVGENTFVPNLGQIGPDNLPYGEYVTGPSDSNTPNLIHCDASDSSPGWLAGATTSQWTEVGGTGGVVCVGTYEEGYQLTLTQNLPVGSPYFGGWSTGAAETLSCTIETGATESNTCNFNDPNNPPVGWTCNTETTNAGTSTALSVSSCYDVITCTPAAGDTLANSPTCTLPLLGNATVGVIFY